MILCESSSEHSIGWKRSNNFISSHLAYRKCNKNTKLRSFLAYFTRQKQFFLKTLKISTPNSFFQNEPKFFYNLFLNYTPFCWNAFISLKEGGVLFNTTFEGWNFDIFSPRNAKKSNFLWSSLRKVLKIGGYSATGCY